MNPNAPFTGSLSFWLFLLILLGLFLFMLGMIAQANWRDWRERRLGHHHRRLGKAAEREAARILDRAGFSILETEPCIEMQLLINGMPRTFEVTPDFLVERDGLVYLVEVKHHQGEEAFSNAAIRRQVIEYLLASETTCLLVSMPEGTIHMIDLPFSGDSV